MSGGLQRLLAHPLLATSDAFQEICWRPATDVHETDEGWLVKFDLAGVQPGDIELSVCGRALTVSGVRRDWSVAGRRHSYCMEIRYNRFSRTIEFPTDLAEADISMEYRDGMLLVRLITEKGGS